MGNKTLIFDFDGTLADTLAFTINSALEISRELKLRNSEKINIEKFRSMDSTAFFKELNISNLKLLYFLLKYQRKLTGKIEDTKTFADLPETLKILKEGGVKIGIVTSNSRKNVKKFLRINDLEIFDFIYASPINYFQKNIILKRVVRKYGLNKEDVIYVGDEVRDIKAAKSACVKIASVSWGYNFESVLSSYKPDFVINRPRDLLSLVK